jgi:cellulose synthase/poly-beta-1,6-N-acetylglucosamine synthase-like glycosyltransferase
MIILEIIVLVFVLLYMYQDFWFLRGFERPRHAKSPQAPVRATVLVAARNEEQNIARCIESLVVQDYPKELLEVIIIDDRSTDRTGAICRDYAARYTFVKVLVAPESSELRGKTNAIDHGVSNASGEIILMTDADCEVPQAWVRLTVEQYGPEVGLVGGMTLHKVRGAFSGMQSVDWAFLLGLASAAVNRRMPLSVIGNNLSFRKRAYQDVGGYRSLKFSVTEDYSLFKAIVNSGKWDYLFPVDRDRIVITEPCESWGDLVRQKHRWGTGGLDMRLYGLYIMVVGFGMHLSTIAALLTGSVAVATTGFMIKCLADYIFLNGVLSKIGRKDILKHFYAFELYYLLYVIALPFIVFFGGKVSWKGRKY